MSSQPVIETDSAMVAALLGLLDAGGRHRLLVDLAESLASDILVAAAEAGDSSIELPFGEDGIDKGELVENFLQQVKPPHDGHAYLDDHWNFIWHDAWPEGVADAILGSVESDGHAAAELMAAIEHKANDIGLPEPPWFDADDLELFIKQWRSRAVQELARLKGQT